jgi:hypothetical protein|tara:strand:- start:4983 stop:5249 length:267 start_codon:yes stop_codon:yes gene_type:complete
MSTVEYSLPLDIAAKINATEEYDETHGGAFDRGGADSYYRRAFAPHYYPQGSYNGAAVNKEDMTAEEIKAYTAGYEQNEKDGNFKDYG